MADFSRSGRSSTNQEKASHSPLRKALCCLHPPSPRRQAPLSEEASCLLLPWPPRIDTSKIRGFAHGVRRKSRQLSTLCSAAPPVSTPGGPVPQPWTPSPSGMTPLQLKCSLSLCAEPSLPIPRDSPPPEDNGTPTPPSSPS